MTDLQKKLTHQKTTMRVALTFGFVLVCTLLYTNIMLEPHILVAALNYVLTAVFTYSWFMTLGQLQSLNQNQTQKDYNMKYFTLPDGTVTTRKKDCAEFDNS